ncbi:CDP-alcohol phosphatidyltransferase family protein [Nocardioides aurantiacus]|uniref:Phosphatidylcholine synthase n=1 Tax=Nocardioides aurantiacus TaxID=86796 RepID=A0A3N2CV00_9ACTN|nr:CDP-alcohol phosphatidyltransferase family protein [Nocardioides aurantiacus]ROR91319.1 phosphatidylcholine synthase [Nocardioides aurantiacus]
MNATQHDHHAARPGPGAVAAAWSVHVYTMSGVAFALLTVIAVIEGDTVRALWLGLVAMVIDGTDGMLARHVRVKEVVPWFDGALLDNIVDYLTYAFTPMVLLWSAGYLGAGPWAQVLAIVPLVASAFQFCRTDAKTEDHLFTGFPSYWNILAFYVVVMDLGLTAVTVLILVCTVLVFVPVGYVYPSRTGTLQALTLLLTTIWLVAYAVLLAQLPDPSPIWLAVSLVYVAYYVVLSIYLTLQRRRSVAASATVGA